ncbi:MAG TPA: LytTR family DNA-binding domain-containing protein [Acidimicrobiales bacterium]
MTGGDGLRVLVVDDEPPAVDELAFLLRQEPDVAVVATATDTTDALRLLHDHDVDAVFLDIRMPGLDGLGLARVLGRFAHPPAVVFVTAFDEHAVEAFELRASDYLLKPVRPERLREALDRVAARRATPAAPAPAAAEGDDLDLIPVETAGRTRFVERDAVRYVEAAGDYARLHTPDGSYLVRTPISTLEARWEGAGFLRIHRGYLVSVRHISEVRAETGKGYVVVVDGKELPVSRRHTRGLKERLMRGRQGR